MGARGRRAALRRRSTTCPASASNWLVIPRMVVDCANKAKQTGTGMVFLLRARMSRGPIMHNSPGSNMMRYAVVRRHCGHCSTTARERHAESGAVTPHQKDSAIDLLLVHWVAWHRATACFLSSCPCALSAYQVWLSAQSVCGVQEARCCAV